MLSNKFVLVQFVVVACLAGLVISAGFDSQVSPIAKTGLVCELCQQIFTEIQNNVEDVEDILEKICKHSDQAEKANCYKALDAIVERVKTKTPVELCQDWGTCKSGLVISARLGCQVNPIAKTGLVCELCQQVFTEIKNNVAAVEEFLNEACETEPDQDRRAKCLKALDAVVERVKSKTPVELCQDWGTCK